MTELRALERGLIATSLVTVKIAVKQTATWTGLKMHAVGAGAITRIGIIPALTLASIFALSHRRNCNSSGIEAEPEQSSASIVFGVSSASNQESRKYTNFFNSIQSFPDSPKPR